MPNSLAEAGSFSSYDRGVRFDGSYAIHTYGSLDGNPDTTAAVLAFSSGIHEYIHGAFESARAVVDGKAVSTRNGLRLVSSQLLEKRQDPIESDDATSIASPTAHTNDLTESSQSQVDQYAVNEYDMSMWLNEATIEYARTKLFGFDVEETAAGYRHGIAVILALERYAGREDVTHARGDEIEATLEGAITGEPVGAMLGRIETVMQHPLAAEKFSHVVNIAAISTINEKEPINDLEFMNMLRAEFHRDELSTEEVNPRSYSNHVDERFFDELRAVMAEHPINPPEKTDALLADKSSTKMRRQRLESQQRVNRFDAASARRANTSGNRFRPAGMNKPAP